MAAPTDLADMLIQLLRSGNERGLPMRPSAELKDWLKARHGNRYMNYMDQPQSAVQFIHPSDDRRGWPGHINPDRPDTWPPGTPVELATTPPISRDPWFDDLEGGIKGYPTRPLGSDPMSMEGPMFIWAEQNGRRVKLDGPFATADEAFRELQLLMRSQSNNELKGLRLSVAPDETFSP